MHRGMLIVLSILTASIVSGPVQAANRPVVAVFQIQDKDASLNHVLLDKLTEYLGTAVAETGAFRVIPPADIQKALAVKKSESYKQCFDQSCQIELGKELAANKTLATSIMRIGKTCVVSARLYDLKTQATDLTAKAKGACSDAALMESLDVVARKIRGEDKKVDLANMVHVPGGEFLMGCDPKKGKACRADEVPQRKIHLDGFFVDKTEVTVAAYRKCVEAGACSDKGLTKPVVHGFDAAVMEPLCNWGKKGREDYPINNVTWFQAEAYCKWAGKRLPTAAEFEKASRGPDGRKYPWGGDKPTCKLAVFGTGCGKAKTWKVGSLPKGASPYCALDMSGNVQEWVADWYIEGYYAKAPARNPQGPEASDSKTLRGGDFSGDDGTLRSAARLKMPPTARIPGVGFRCVLGK